MRIDEIIAKLEEMAKDREDILPGCLGCDEAQPLREAIALLKTHPEAQPNEPVRRWISVKDKLPEGDDCNLALVVVSGRYRNITFDRAIELAEYDPVACEWILESYPEFENPGVTHWMPLPELPKGV